MTGAMPPEGHDPEERHWWRRGHRHAVVELGRRLVPPGGVVVQVGCGAGSIIDAFPASFERHGIDPSPAVIADARARHPGVTFHVGEAAAGGVEAMGRADLVVACGVLERAYDDVALLDDILSGMASGAHLLLTVPARARGGAGDGEPADERRYTRRSLARTWRGLPVSPRFLAPLNRRLSPVERPLRRLGAWPSTAGPVGTGEAGVPWRPVNAALERLLAGEVHALVAGLKASPREIQGRGTALVAVLERAPALRWVEAASGHGVGTGAPRPAPLTGGARRTA